MSKRYSEEQVESGLQALAIYGNTGASQATGIPPETLSYWQNHSRVERYQEIRKEILPRIRAKLAVMYEDNAALALQKASDTLSSLDPEKLSQTERSKAVQQLAVASGVYFDKASIARDLPTQIVEHRTGEELLRALKGLAPQFTSNEAAITDAQVVEELPQRT